MKAHMGNEDRISSLPDEVLCEILSFLPTKFSVRTSILSTRWKHLFTFVPVLHFDHWNENAPDRNITSFIQFVNAIFPQYNVSRMNKFFFHFLNDKHPHTDFPFFSWISSVVQRHVQQVDIQVFLAAHRTLPLDLFSCRTLTDLTLRGQFDVVIPHLVCLPSLRNCVLAHVRFNDESARRLFQSCPLLEKLEINGCHMVEGAQVLNISAPNLKHFAICDIELEQIVFNVPNLVKFEFHGPATNGFRGLESLKSVDDACIFCEPESPGSDLAVVELVQANRHVGMLGLSYEPMEAFQRAGHSLPTFSNLTILYLGPLSSFCPKFLSDLLNNSPRLEYIFFDEGSGDYHDGADEINCLLPEHVPVCVSQHLQEVNFIYFTGLDHEIKVIKYFLKYAKNLKININSKYNCSEQFEVSSGQEIVFFSDYETDFSSDDEC